MIGLKKERDILYSPAGGSRMQGRPTLIVLPINIGSMLHQELNHVEIIIDAGLQKESILD